MTKKKRPPRVLTRQAAPPTHVKRFCGMKGCPGHYVPRVASVGDIVAFDEPADALGPAVHYVGEVKAIADSRYEVEITSSIRGPLQPGEIFWCEHPRVVPTLCGVKS